MLEALGFELELPPERIERSIDELGFGFLFAQAHHPAMRHAAPVRRELATRTVFNVLGPLTNPAGARALVLGVYSPEPRGRSPTRSSSSRRRAPSRPRRRRHRRALPRADLVCGSSGTSEYELDRSSSDRRCDPRNCAAATVDERGGAARGARGRGRRPPLGVTLDAAGGIAAPGHARDTSRKARASRSALRRLIDPAVMAAAPTARPSLRSSTTPRMMGSLLSLRFPPFSAGPAGAVAEFKRRPRRRRHPADAQVEDVVPAYQRGGARAVRPGRRRVRRVARRPARRATTAELPLLAKGFFSTQEDLRDVREAGGDRRSSSCATSSRNAARSSAPPEELGLDALVEAHDEEGLERATASGAVIGVDARDLGTFRIDRAARLGLVAQGPAGPVVVAESAVHTRAQAAAAELAGATRPRRHVAHAARTRRQAPRAALAAARQGLRPHAAGGRRRRGRGGADLSASSSPRARPAGRLPCSTCPTPCSASPFSSASPRSEAPTSSSCTRDEEGGARRDAVLSATASRSPRADLPWEGQDPEHWQNAAPKTTASCRRPARAGQRARGDRRRPPVGGGRRVAARVRPGVKDHDKVRAFVKGRAHEHSATTAAATSPRR